MSHVSGVLALNVKVGIDVSQIRHTLFQVLGEAGGPRLSQTERDGKRNNREAHGGHSPFSLLLCVPLTTMSVPFSGNLCPHASSHLFLQEAFKAQVPFAEYDKWIAENNFANTPVGKAVAQKYRTIFGQGARWGEENDHVTEESFSERLAKVQDW
jgi:hypothetical protein